MDVMDISRYTTGRLVIEGIVHDHRGSHQGYAIVEDGNVSSTGRGQSPEEPDFIGDMYVDIVNAHTHCGDYGLKVPSGLSLEELVAPPNGLKHRYLAGLSDNSLAWNISQFSKDSRSYGSSTFVDFREGGVVGCRALREVAPEAVILGRPISKEYDPEEMDEILSVADGIGIPSISDMSLEYIEQISDEVRSRNAILGIHVSERVREDIDAVLSLDPAFIVHMCEATDEDLLKCAEAEVPVVVCPTSNMYFGKVTPIARMQQCGVDVAIGTDNGMLCAPDVVSEVRLLSELAFKQGGNPEECWGCMNSISSKFLNRDTHIFKIGAGSDMVVRIDDCNHVVFGYK